MVKKRVLIIYLAVALIAGAVGAFFLHQHITNQRELNIAIEQEQRLNQLYIALNRNRPLLLDDPMEIQQVVIGLAGLRSIGFSQEEVEKIWTSSAYPNAPNSPDNHPDFNEISTFIFEGEIASFEAELRRTLSANFEVIADQFPGIEDAYIPFMDVPLPALHHLIALYESENPPQPRPVAETMESWINEDGTLNYLEIGNLMSKGIDNLAKTELDALTMLFGNPDIQHMDMARVYQFAIQNTPRKGFWNTHEVLKTITERLAEEFMLKTFDLLWTGTYKDPSLRTGIETQMHRIQMLAFIVGLGRHRGIKNHLTDYLELDFERHRIQYLRVSGTLSRFRGLFHGTYIFDSVEPSSQQNFAAAPAIFVKTVTAHGLAGDLSDALNAINNNPDLSDAEKQLMKRLLSLGVVRLGGGVFSVHMNGNYILLGMTLATQRAMISLTGLEAEGISLDIALAALADRSHPQHRLVDQYVLNQGGGWGRFADELFGVYQDNFNAISIQFPDFDLAYHTSPGTLPLPVLEEVIRIWSGG